MTRKQRAIKIIKECRDIHQEWIDMADSLTPVQTSIGGNTVHHQRWVDNYNYVIEVLRERSRDRRSQA